MTHRKLTSRLEGRRHAYERMKVMMNKVPQMTDEELMEEIAKLTFHSYVRSEGTTREVIVCQLATCLAHRIIDAP